MVLVDTMIRNKRFKDFIGEMVRIQNDESEDRTIWEFWLHRIWDMSFGEFCDLAKKKQGIQTTISDKPNQEELKEAVQNSVNILNGFCLS